MNLKSASNLRNNTHANEHENFKQSLLMIMMIIQYYYNDYEEEEEEEVEVEPKVNDFINVSDKKGRY